MYGRPLTSSISLEEYLDFTSGYQDPLFPIPTWNIPPPSCHSQQANVSAFSGNPSSADQDLNLLGSQSLDWDFTLSFSTTDSASLLDSTSLPSTSSNSPAVTNNLQPDSSLNTISNWNIFPLPVSDSNYLDDGTQLLSGNPSMFTASEEHMNLVALSSDMATTASAPMIKGWPILARYDYIS